MPVTNETQFLSLQQYPQFFLEGNRDKTSYWPTTHGSVKQCTAVLNAQLLKHLEAEGATKTLASRDITTWKNELHSKFHNHQLQAIFQQSKTYWPDQFNPLSPNNSNWNQQIGRSSMDYLQQAILAMTPSSQRDTGKYATLQTNCYWRGDWCKAQCCLVQDSNFKQQM